MALTRRNARLDISRKCEPRARLPLRLGVHVEAPFESPHMDAHRSLQIADRTLNPGALASAFHLRRKDKRNKKEDHREHQSL